MAAHKRSTVFHLIPTNPTCCTICQCRVWHQVHRRLHGSAQGVQRHPQAGGGHAQPGRRDSSRRTPALGAHHRWVKVTAWCVSILACYRWVGEGTRPDPAWTQRQQSRSGCPGSTSQVGGTYCQLQQCLAGERSCMSQGEGGRARPAWTLRQQWKSGCPGSTLQVNTGWWLCRHAAASSSLELNW
jgi:hypothetical protein